MYSPRTLKKRQRPLRFSLPGGIFLRSMIPPLAVMVAAFVLATAAGCDRNTGNAEPVVRLDNLTALPSGSIPPQPDSLKVAVAAILSPQGTVQSYRHFLDYLGEKTEKKVILVQRKTYQEVNDMLSRGVVDVAFICTGAYLEGIKKNSMDLLVIPQVNGKRTYQALFIVPSHSQADSIRDLRGKIFAFTDPLSNTGYLYPLSVLQQLGEKPETFFRHTIFTYSHDRSIYALREGVADGASVDSIIYEFATQKDPHIAGLTKVIHRSQEFGMPPVVVPKQTKPETAARLKNIFLSAHTNQDGLKALDEIGIDRFVEPDENLYLNLMPR